MGDGFCVHVVDDDEAIRESLSFLLATAGFPVRPYASAQAFLDCLPTVRSGCLITDVRMPDMDGIELLRCLRARGADLPVIVITGHGDIPLAVEAMKIGAIDFIEKPFDDERLIAAIRAACLPPSAPGTDHPETVGFSERLALLSRRERQVFDGLARGHTNKAMARDYDISPRTVEVYRANVMAKMQAGSISELVRMAMKLGILT
jgi:two-component system response regulator FixJ